MNFIFVGLQRINTDRESTATSLAKELSKNHRVLYVNPPIDRRTWFKQKEQDKFTQEHILAIKNAKPPLTQCSDNLWVLNPPYVIESINWIPNTRIFSFLNYYNNKRFAKDIKSALTKVGIDSFTLVNDKDIFRSFYLKEILKPELYIYLDRDYTLGFDYWKRHGIQLEPKLMAKSDGVVCNSLDFTRRASQFNKQSFYIGNGGGIADDMMTGRHFDKPAELKGLSGPIIGYVGVLNAHRLDIALIERLALHFRQANIVLIGPEDEVFERSALHRLHNILFISKKDKEKIPAYVHYFDVCINPQLMNEITMGNFPLKIVEYLAMGKATVATGTNTMREVFASHTYLANTTDEFILKTEQAMNENNDHLAAERKLFSKQFSWDNVANGLLKAISEIKENGRQ